MAAASNNNSAHECANRRGIGMKDLGR
ncbi:hypothetical protein XaFJ1_GM000802 [Xanthomonas albilineans]|nr:hypothetical protein XaFJ1_GM000802 [Xanthomonas albilineans]